MNLKRFILFTVTFFFSCTGISQNWLWARGSISNSTDEGYSVANDSAGNAYIAGYYNSTPIKFGSTLLTNSGIGDVFLAKYDPNGNLLWAQRAGGSSDERAYALTVDVQGNVLLTGYFQSSSITFGSTVLNNSGGPDIFIAKYDPNGNILWAKKAGGTAQDMCKAVCTDKNGNIFITGNFMSPTITFGAFTLTNNGFTDIFVTKYDINGNVLWAKNPTCTFYDEGFGISTDASGNVFITGYFQSSPISFGSSTLPPSGSADSFLAKYDSNGNPLWARNQGSTGSDMGNFTCNDQKGNAYVTGFYSGAITLGTIVLSAPNGSDMFLAKYDPNGNILWAKTGNGSLQDVGYTCVTDTSENVYVSGWFQGNSINFGPVTLYPPTGSTDPMFIVKYDSLGKLLCAAALKTGGDDNNGLSIDRSGNIFTTSDFVGNSLTIGNDVLLSGTGNNVENIFVAKFDFVAPLVSPTVNDPVCAGQSINLSTTSVNGAVYLWNGPGGFYSANQHPTIANAIITNGGVYSVTVTANGCWASDSILVNVHPLPVITSIGQVSCNGMPVQLNAAGANSYTWIPATGLNNNTISNPIAMPSVNTQYTVSGTDIFGCVNNTISLVTVSSVTAAISANPLSGTAPLITHFIANSNCTYWWDFGNGTTQNSSSDTTHALYPNPGTYTVIMIATNTMGCSDTDRVIILAEIDTSLSIPNIFSPNGDGINDLFFIKNSGYTNIEITVLDRWGVVIWESSSRNGSWDGKKNNIDVPTGTYYYVLKAITNKQQVRSLKGYILLSR